MIKRGFTLIELMIVMSIIAILAAISVPNFLEAQVRSKVSRVKQDMDVMEAALHAYYAEYNAYPPSAPGVLEALQNPWSGLDSRYPAFYPLVIRTLPPLGAPPGTAPVAEPAATPTPTPQTYFAAYAGYEAYSAAPPRNDAGTIAILKSGYALSVLTTPVPYLTHSLPVDPFFGGIYNDRYLPFGYVNLVEAREAYGLSHGEESRRYYLFSHSPQNALAPNPLVERIVEYDPTNGTISPGFLARFGGGDFNVAADESPEPAPISTNDDLTYSTYYGYGGRPR